MRALARVLCGVALALALGATGCDAETPPALDADARDAGALDAGAPDAGPPPCPLDAWPSAAAAREEAVVAELNTRRASVASCGATSVGPSGPITHDPALRRAARCHAFDMMIRERPGAMGSDGSSYEERALREGYAGTTVTEAYGILGDTQSAGAIVDLLMSDRVVCGALFAPSTTGVGIGLARDPDALGTTDTTYLEVVAGR